MGSSQTRDPFIPQPTDARQHSPAPPRSPSLDSPGNHLLPAGYIQLHPVLAIHRGHWEKVSHQVGTRSVSQVYQHWCLFFEGVEEGLKPSLRQVIFDHEGTGSEPQYEASFFVEKMYKQTDAAYQ